MKSSYLFSAFLLLTAFSSANAADYWFSRGASSETATRNWSDLNNWSTSSISGTGWNSNVSLYVPGAVATNYDKVNLGVNSGYNGSDTTISNINLDTNATIELLSLSNADNLPTSITSTNGSVLTLRAAVKNSTSADSSPGVLAKSNSDSFTINSDVVLVGAIGTTNGTSYSNLYNKIYVNAGILTFADGYTLSTAANPISNTTGEIRFYVGKSSSIANQAVVNINSKIVTGSQIVLANNGSGNVAGKYVIGGTQSNAFTSSLVVEQNTTLELAKTGGAIAVSGSRLRILGGKVVWMGDNQMGLSTQLAFAQDNSSSGNVPVVNLNGYSQTINNNINMASAEWLGKGTYLVPVLDFGTAGTSQTFQFAGFSFGALIAESAAATTKGLIISKSYLSIQNYVAGEDHFISTVQLSSKLISTTIAEVAGKTWMDLLVFAGYDMDEYNLVEVSNGLNWEYKLVPVPEPATCAAILGAIALAMSLVRRKK